MILTTFATETPTMSLTYRLRLVFALTCYCYGAVLFLAVAFLCSPIGMLPCDPVFDRVSDWLVPRLDALHLELFGEDTDDDV